ncbi:uroporphyrinogen-III C-methyltransferase [Ideonella oryzae]|uniref:uroporphyrinogen-III C-methyltransferase n=1 Tax=Ideonella oryzae TaxID=2937441 RepID=A0ABT1BP97_9BURK|nr:uroporphyrinogen-III C-methyltransferase [Ideonella oryzae]MCO5978048.1 uroporphyrinogen-III C-methyltransferase [Ideonella oryzae]
MPSGHVVFIGAGPGAADLITLRGLAALQQAEVVLADALTDPALREHAPQAEWIDVGKRGFAHATGQARINTLLVEQALAGRRVARLKGGDPSIFGRLEEELQALAEAGIACEVIPGVTAAVAAAAQSQRPLTRRGQGRTVALTTAMTLQHALQAGHHADTEVFYMAGQQLVALADSLQACGWPLATAVSVVSRAGCADAQVSAHTVGSLAQAAALHAGRPAVVTVGVGATPATAAPGPAEVVRDD